MTDMNALDSLITGLSDSDVKTIEIRLAQVEKTLAAQVELLQAIKDAIEPTLAALENSPILKMMGIGGK